MSGRIPILREYSKMSDRLPATQCAKVFKKIPIMLSGPPDLEGFIFCVYISFEKNNGYQNFIRTRVIIMDT